MIDLNTLSLQAWIVIGILGLIVSEIIYFIFVRSTTLKEKDSLLAFTVDHKLKSVILTVFGGLLIVLLSSILSVLLIVGGIAGIVAIYIGSNYWLAKTFIKRETKKEAQARLKEEEAEKKNRYPWKAGQRVRVETALRFGSEEDAKLAGKIVTIQCINTSYPECPYRVVGSNGRWAAGCFKKVRGNK